MPTYQVKRTLKFLQAISHVRHILDEDWVRQSLLAGHFVDEARFMLLCGIFVHIVDFGELHT